MLKSLRCRVCDGYSIKGGPWLNKAQAHDRCLPHECPQCKGLGRIVSSWETKKSCCHGGPLSSGSGSFAGCEYCPKAHIDQIPSVYKDCDLCNGAGRLEFEPTPITKITGWRR